MPDQQSQLHYEPRHHVAHRRRGRWIAGIITAMVLILTAIRFGPAMYERLLVLHWQRQCMNFMYPPSASAPLPIPLAARELFGRIGLSPGGTSLAFLHGRRSPNGNTRLVVVTTGFKIGLGGYPIAHLRATIVIPGGWTARPSFPTTIERPLTFLSIPVTRISSVPDPVDESHFTITLDDEQGQQHIIDGWLRDDDTVLLEARPPVLIATQPVK